MNDWHIAYVLAALNPVFLIVNILITSLEICSASVAAAGTNDFCVNVMDFLSATSTTTSTTTMMSPSNRSLLASEGTVGPCNIVHSMFDEDANATVTYTVNMCSTTTPFFSTTTLARAAFRYGYLQAF